MFSLLRSKHDKNTPPKQTHSPPIIYTQDKIFYPAPNNKEALEWTRSRIQYFEQLDKQGHSDFGVKVARRVKDVKCKDPGFVAFAPEMCEVQAEPSISITPKCGIDSQHTSLDLACRILALFLFWLLSRSKSYDGKETDMAGAGKEGSFPWEDEVNADLKGFGQVKRER